MKILSVPIFLALLLSGGALAQGNRRHNTPGMQTPTGAERIMQGQEQENPGHQEASNIPVPDLLQNAKSMPPKQLSDFEALALKNNPTLKQAQSMVRTSAGLARQAGLWPNPSVGYQGEEIRGGSFRGGEQGGFVQQNIVLGGKLQLRRMPTSSSAKQMKSVSKSNS
jgi:cobalt-zinc-cadmium efflux system outer membrane protein